MRSPCNWHQRLASQPVHPRRRRSRTPSSLVGELTKQGDLRAGAESLRELARQQADDGLHWYRAITLLNMALALEWAGDLEEALEAARLAEGEMARLGSRGVERAAVLVGKANILAKLGRMAEAARYLDEALAFPSSLARSEAAIEACRLWATFGDRRRSRGRIRHRRHGAGSRQLGAAPTDSRRTGPSVG